jgi:hypothetical protein
MGEMKRATAREERERTKAMDEDWRALKAVF